MKTYMPDGKTLLVDAAREYATFAHAGQFRRDGVTPYIEHPRKVAALLEGESDEVIAVAHGHDIFEDSHYTMRDMLDAGFPMVVVTAIHALTKRPGDNYHTYLHRVAQDPIARRVKIADMLANLTDSPTPRQVERYTKGILFLSSMVI